MHQEIEWVRSDLVAFERARQAELQAEIQALADDLEAAGDGAFDEEMKGMMAAFSNIAEKDAAQEEEARKKTLEERKIDSLWEDHKENEAHAKGALLLERERQRAKMLERLEEKKRKKLLKKVERIEKQLAEKRAQASAKIKEIEDNFSKAVVARTKAMKKLRNKAMMIRKKAAHGAPPPSSSTAAGGAGAGAGSGGGAGAGAEEWDASAGSPWVELVCEHSGHVYWYNPQTDQAQWDLPEDYAAAEGFHSAYVDGHLGDAAVAELDAAADLAEEWVSQELLEYEQRRTAELESVAADMRLQLERSKGVTADDLLGMLEGIMEMEDEEEDVAHKADKIFKDHVANTKKLTDKMVDERERQRKNLEDRVRKKQERLLQRKRKRLRQQLQRKAKRAGTLKALVRSEAEWQKRRVLAGVFTNVSVEKRAAMAIKSRAQTAVRRSRESSPVHGAARARLSDDRPSTVGPR